MSAQPHRAPPVWRLVATPSHPGPRPGHRRVAAPLSGQGPQAPVGKPAPRLKRGTLLGLHGRGTTWFPTWLTTSRSSSVPVETTALTLSRVSTASAPG